MTNTLDLIVIWVNLALTLAVVIVNAYAAGRDEPRRRPVWGGIAVLAALYSVGYVWVLLDGDVSAWSRVFRGISVAAWGLVWLLPPLLFVSWHKDDVRKVEQLRDDLEG